MIDIKRIQTTELAQRNHSINQQKHLGFLNGCPLFFAVWKLYYMHAPVQNLIHQCTRMQNRSVARNQQEKNWETCSKASKTPKALTSLSSSLDGRFPEMREWLNPVWFLHASLRRLAIHSEVGSLHEDTCQNVTVKLPPTVQAFEPSKCCWTQSHQPKGQNFQHWTSKVCTQRASSGTHNAQGSTSARHQRISNHNTISTH